MTTLICYYGLGLPLGLYLGFKKHLGVKGFWMGYLFALVIYDVIVFCFVILADWSPKSFLKEKSAQSQLENEEDGKEIAE